MVNILCFLYGRFRKPCVVYDAIGFLCAVPLQNGGGPAKRKDLSKNHYNNICCINSTIGRGGNQR